MNFLETTYGSRCLVGNVPLPETITENQPNLDTTESENKSQEGDSHNEQAGDGSAPSVTEDKRVTTEKTFKSPKKKDPFEDLLQLESQIAHLKWISGQKERNIVEAKTISSS